MDSPPNLKFQVPSVAALREKKEKMKMDKRPFWPPQPQLCHVHIMLRQRRPLVVPPRPNHNLQPLRDLEHHLQDSQHLRIAGFYAANFGSLAMHFCYKMQFERVKNIYVYRICIMWSIPFFYKVFIYMSIKYGLPISLPSTVVSYSATSGG